MVKFPKRDSESFEEIKNAHLRPSKWF